MKVKLLAMLAGAALLAAGIWLGGMNQAPPPVPPTTTTTIDRCPQLQKEYGAFAATAAVEQAELEAELAGLPVDSSVHEVNRARDAASRTAALAQQLDCSWAVGKL